VKDIKNLLSDSYKKHIINIFGKLDGNHIVLSIEQLDTTEQFKDLTGIKCFELRTCNNKNHLYFERLIGKDKEKGLLLFRDELHPINLDDYCFFFPFLDGTGLMVITNSPMLFCEVYNKWIELNRPKMFRYLMILSIYLEVLTSIEKKGFVTNEIAKKLLLIKKAKKISMETTSQQPFKMGDKFFKMITDISVYPRLKHHFNTNKKIQALSNSVLPYIENNYKGQAWFSFSLTIILYTFLSEDEKLINQVESEDLYKLRNICNLIKGRNLSNKFFNMLFTFCEIYVRRFIRNPEYIS